jgi:hypothetical protein
MRVSFAGSFPKAPNYADDNEDVFLISDNDRRIVLCDGAGESFDPQTWARLLARRFADSSYITSEWAEVCAKDYQSRFDFSLLSWSQQAAFERGSFATLLGVEWNETTEVLEIVAIGDSVAFLVENSTIIESWPYRTVEQFHQRPVLLSTISALNGFLQGDDFRSQHYTAWRVSGSADTVMMCMTDALAQWVLRAVQEHDPAWKQLLTLQSAAELGDLVLSERAAKRMKTDDSTLIVCRFDHSGVPL